MTLKPKGGEDVASELDGIGNKEALIDTVSSAPLKGR
jgi:hypothetical protein